MTRNEARFGLGSLLLWVLRNGRYDVKAYKVLSSLKQEKSFISFVVDVTKRTCSILDISNFRRLEWRNNERF